MILFPVNAGGVQSGPSPATDYCLERSGIHNSFVGVPGTEKAYEGYCRVARNAGFSVPCFDILWYVCFGPIRSLDGEAGQLSVFPA